RFGFAQEADDLFFGKTLLHVQSPWGRELDSKLRCYSKLGGRRTLSQQSQDLRQPGVMLLPAEANEVTR
ncbi:hypothetical protein, partial [Xanthomonas perforans]|uniref:hypothetical protein n=1 Tax=Xanthomonas perforans TaxID=442694 RepID=UPI00321BC01A